MNAANLRRAIFPLEKEIRSAVDGSPEADKLAEAVNLILDVMNGSPDGSGADGMDDAGADGMPARIGGGGPRRPDDAARSPIERFRQRFAGGI